MMLPDEPLTAQPYHVRPRPHVSDKFIYTGGEKLYIRGVTYGTFRPDSDGCEQHDPLQVARDFAQMRAAGINAVRTYTVPSRWFLDLALEHNLYVMIGLPWEQHITFLDDLARQKDIVNRVRNFVREVAEHPAILCYTIGNEIPSSIVRWHGARKVERFLRGLYDLVKREDPAALVTYVNYPSTEYLQLPFVDFFCFNVYLETEPALDDYLARLQNIAGDRPLVMAEIGLDSRRNGVTAQAETLQWQVRTAFAAGCAGAFVFAWTDEWWRGGYDIDDWDFGLVTREREPKPALAAVSRAFAEVPFAVDPEWPRISVVVCSYNGSRVIRDCLDGLMRLEYPNFEVIVVSDGSTDQTAQIVSEYPFRLISTENRGLSSARNTGMLAATGEIVAYTDDDARPDPHWLQYLAHSFRKYGFAGVGGPNIAPAGDGLVADCVANAPGGPVHILLSDRVAEHIPGCNMAFRHDVLQEVGGCDPLYRVAGDDVDLCWRVQQAGGTIGFHPAALVWHHRRNFIKNYWKQQQGYGKAEALLEEKWPEKYNSIGHLTWGGRLYSKGITQALRIGGERVHHGVWGAGLFQSVYEPTDGTLRALPLMPEWFFVIFVLGVLTAFGLVWRPLLVASPFFVLALAAPITQALVAARRAQFTSNPATQFALFKLQTITAFLHLLQPLARLIGRLRWGLTPWRRRVGGWVAPLPRSTTLWSETWRSREERLGDFETRLRESRAIVLRGGDYDRWDLEVRGGMLGAARVLTTVEEHGAGRQLLRARTCPRVSPLALLAVLFITALAALVAWKGAWLPALFIVSGSFLLGARILLECGAAMSSMLSVLVVDAIRVPQVTEEEKDEATAPRTSPVVARPEPPLAPVGVAHFEVEG